MEISKHHANIFLMSSEDPVHGAGRSQSATPKFAIADSGSTHGTFVRHRLASGISVSAQESAALPTSEFQRLSAAKKASAPRLLKHLDLLRFGGTTFEAHCHAKWPWTCSDCTLNSTGTNEITLYAEDSKTKATASNSATSSGPALSSSFAATRGSGDRKVDTEVERRKQMKSLRSTFLGKAKVPKVVESSTSNSVPLGARTGSGSAQNQAYIDRAAARRSLHVGNPPGLSMKSSAQHLAEGPAERVEDVITVPTSASVPLNASNRGFQLFQKMGAGLDSASRSPSGSPGPQGGPVMATATEGRAGLGSRPLRGLDDLSGSSSTTGGVNNGKRKPDAYREEGRDASRRRYETMMGKEPS